MSLLRLSLREFVIVETLDWEVASGFTVLTGETGAGKSILIDALQWLLGGRSDAGLLREGASRMEVNAEFSHHPALLAWLDDNGFATEDVLLLKRVMDAQGKSRSWINGSPASVQALRQLADHLVDIHGQHAWQSLTRSADVRRLLDAYAGCNTQPVQAAWRVWQQAHEAWQTALSAQAQLNERRDQLSWQLQQLDALAPQADEWETLNSQHTRLAHAQQLIEAAQQAQAWLEDEADNARSLVVQAKDALADQVHVEPGFAPLVEQLQGIEAQIADVGRDVSVWLKKTEVDPDALQTLDDRLTQWHGLARRFKRPPEGLHELWQSWQQELASLDAQTDPEGLAREATRLEGVFLGLAQDLSRQRQQAAPRLGDAITELMQTLGMAGGRFEVQLATLPQPTAHGLEEVVFAVAGHAGTSPKPLAKVASGGELSRIALCVAVITSQLGHAPTLIFDEIDSGVGGVVAHTVGQLMARLGKDRQVMAVTHLPQVAAQAHHHWVVSKSSSAQGTVSQVQAVAANDRVLEIARMLGDAEGESATLAHARSLLQLKSPRKAASHV